jgi:hypothetical protein
VLAAGSVHAQAPVSPDEIAFWETVRDSRNPAELQAYIDQYPNGRFVVLAKARLAALGAKPAPQPARPQRVEPPVASVPSQSYAAGVRMPQVGDTWTYRLSHPRLRGQWGQKAKPARTHVVRVDSVPEGKIIDQLSVDGSTPTRTSLSAGSYLVPQGVSVFSPYLATFGDLAATARLGRVEILDPECSGDYVCEASARTLGTETVTVPAGTFSAIKVLVEQSWRPSSGSGSSLFQGGQMTGGRHLTVWYAPEVKRAVKFASRPTVGEIPPVDANFDLELVSYQLK